MKVAVRWYEVRHSPAVVKLAVVHVLQIYHFSQVIREDFWQDRLGL